MLANFFGKTDPINLIIIFVLFLGFALSSYFSGFSESNSVLWLASLLGLYVLLFFFFNFILAKNKLTLYNSYGFLFFVLLFGIFPFVIFDRQELVSNLILLILLKRIYSLRTSKEVFKKNSIVDFGLQFSLFWIHFHLYLDSLFMLQFYYFKKSI